MNYRDFYKKEQTLAGPTPMSEKINIENLSPRIRTGIEVELEHTPSRGKSIEEADPKDIAHALKVAKDHWKEDKNYYDKLTKAGLEECGDMKSYGGLTPLQPVTALDVPSRIRPVSIVNLMNPAVAFGGRTQQSNPATAVGSVADDKEKIVAAGETDPSIAQKSVGGPVVPGGGQEKGGPNTKGHIAGTPKNLQSKSECGGPNTKGSVGGTPKNPALGLKGSDLIKGGLGVSTSQSHLGQFEKKEHPLSKYLDGEGEEDLSKQTERPRGINVYEEEEEEKDDSPLITINGGTVDQDDLKNGGDEEEVSLETPDGEDNEDNEKDEEGEDVTIKLNESFKNLIKEVISEVIEEKTGKKFKIGKLNENRFAAMNPDNPDAQDPYGQARMMAGDNNEPIHLDIEKLKDVEVDGVDNSDYPDFTDAYVVSAVYPTTENPKGPNDWRELSDEEIEWLNDEHPEVAQQAAHGRMHDAGDFGADAAKDREMGLEEDDKNKCRECGKPIDDYDMTKFGGHCYDCAKKQASYDESVTGIEETAKIGPKGLGKKETPKFKDKPTQMKKPATQTISKLQKEAAFISRKINEGRQLTEDEKKIIKEIIISKAVRMKEEMDEKGWEHAAEGQQGMLDAFAEDAVKYRSSEDTVEDLVDSIAMSAEDHLGIRHIDYDHIEEMVRQWMQKYPAKY